MNESVNYKKLLKERKAKLKILDVNVLMINNILMLVKIHKEIKDLEPVTIEGTSVKDWIDDLYNQVNFLREELDKKVDEK